MNKIIQKSAIKGIICAPCSKSYAQRAIAGALLCYGRSVLRKVELSDDNRAALAVAGSLGAMIEAPQEGVFDITGGLSVRHSTLDVGESGLCTRLFTPIAALCQQPITITGHGSIMGRPVEMMRSPLEQLGAIFTTTGGLLPLTVQGPLRAGHIQADGSLSSQFISGLLFALPLCPEGSTLEVDNLQSIPYIDITLDVLRTFGINVENRNYKQFLIPAPQRYQRVDLTVEGDWSGASCMLVAGAIAGQITIQGLNKNSVQADRKIIEALTLSGANLHWADDQLTVTQAPLHSFEFDATHCPDLFPALVALASACQGTTIIRGTNRLAHKESNRALTLRDEFGKMGIHIDLQQDNIMTVQKGEPHAALVHSHGDHRIAMACAVAALRTTAQVEIAQPEAVNKSYPNFWDDLRKIIIEI